MSAADWQTRRLHLFNDTTAERIADHDVDDEEAVTFGYKPTHALVEIDVWDALRARVTELEAERDARSEVLGNLWLYVHWRYCSKQLTTEQKELWADCIDGWTDSTEPVADRWWRVLAERAEAAPSQPEGNEGP